VQQVTVGALDKRWTYNVSATKIDKPIGSNQLTATVEMRKATFVNLVRLQIAGTNELAAYESVELIVDADTSYPTTNDKGFITVDKLNNKLMTNSTVTVSVKNSPNYYD